MELEMIDDLMEDFRETKAKNDYLRSRLKRLIRTGSVDEIKGYYNALIQGESLLKDINDIIHHYSINN